MLMNYILLIIGVYAADIFWMFSAILMIFHTLSYMTKRPVTSDMVNEYYRFINIPIYLTRRFVRLWPSLIVGKY